MENVIEAIQKSLQSDADDAARADGVRACRAVLAALEAKVGEPLAAQSSATPMQAVVAGLSGLPVEQLLDLAIAKLKTIVPVQPQPTSAAVSTSAQPLRFHLLPVPAEGRRS